MTETEIRAAEQRAETEAIRAARTREAAATGEVLPALVEEPAPAVAITVRYSAIDGYSKSRSFKTLAGACRFAHHYVGEHPDMGSGYAVSFDGVGKVTVRGASLAALFPPRA